MRSFSSAGCLYGICLAGKYTRDPESFDMIRIAREHVVYDPIYLYSWVKVYTTLNSAVKARKENTASTIETLTKVAEQAIEDYVQAIRTDSNRNGVIQHV